MPAAAVTIGVDGSPSAVLAAVAEHRAAAEAAHLAVIFDAIEWAAMHSPEAVPPDGWATVPGTCGEVSLTGPGAPRVSEFCIAEFAAAAGLSTESGTELLADAIEVRYRLPRIWERLTAGHVPVWRARLITRHTRSLSQTAAGWVDRQLAHCAHRVGPAQVQRAIDEALIRFDPGQVEDRNLADNRYVRVGSEADLDGSVQILALVDAADAFDVDSAVGQAAELRAKLGDQDSLDVRRARGLGDLARRQLALDLTGTIGEGEEVAVPSRPATSIYFHLDARSAYFRHDVGSELTGHPATAESGDVAFTMGNRDGGVVNLDRLLAWLESSGTRVTVRPVIDLGAETVTESYSPTIAQREQIFLRDRTCTFPYCNRPARPPGHRPGVDADHITPYDSGGPTATSNLAALCRHHHRHKTHTAWTYTPLEPGTYLWTSPHGLAFIRTRDGTTPAPRASPD
ncbi:MAG: DUF222 domain-containing protein [Nocardioides sp.]